MHIQIIETVPAAGSEIRATIERELHELFPGAVINVTVQERAHSGRAYIHSAYKSRALPDLIEAVCNAARIQAGVVEFEMERSAA